ncbi:MAG TPA: alcohol dehydrogenase catalytic domain-containing protein [Nocardioidaceae bacterium]|nr:alcohol dehydrogenase catalytic domain-containing protein [Nocardioidaceae bacterium]
MRGVYLPGDRRVDVRSVPDPEPGHGQVLLRPRASTICGSDLRAIYREHLGTGPEAYRDVVAGHEPCGDVVALGPGCTRVREGERVVVYHISGCGLCDECRRGYHISCTSSQRRAYGWQRDGGHADLMVADERDLLTLPDSLTHLDGACVACGFATAYEALARAGVSGADTVLVTGLGPVGLAAGLLARALGSAQIVGTDPNADRRKLAEFTSAVDHAPPGDDDLRDLLGDGASVAVECSGSGAGRVTAVRHTARWGRCVLVGEGPDLALDASRDVIHRQLTLIGSWVSSTVRTGELLGLLDRWRLHPERIVTDRFPLEEAERAYRVADEGAAGKVGLVMNGLDGTHGTDGMDGIDERGSTS